VVTGSDAGLQQEPTKAALRERRNVFQSSLISLDRAHQHANAPHPLRLLLRPRRQRTRGRRAAEQRDELAPLHLVGAAEQRERPSALAQAPQATGPDSGARAPVIAQLENPTGFYLASTPGGPCTRVMRGISCSPSSTDRLPVVSTTLG
jgi:hypothetical protein